VQKRAPEAQQQGNMANHALSSYKEVEAIFDTCPLEGTVSKENAIYINEACRTNYQLSNSVDWSPSVPE